MYISTQIVLPFWDGCCEAIIEDEINCIWWWNTSSGWSLSQSGGAANYTANVHL